MFKYDEDEIINNLKEFSYRGQTIPDYMWNGIMLYIVEHIKPGSFLSAIISNDLSGACRNADDTNIDLLPVYVSFFYNCAPSSCSGSQENFRNWLEKRNDISS